MSDTLTQPRTVTTRRVVVSLSLLCLLAAALWWPEEALDLLRYLAWSLVEIAPLVIPGILLAAWVSASGAGRVAAGVFQGHLVSTVVLASLIGALTPVCGVTVLPLMAGLLAAGVPLAPIMAFWLSSPVTDPAMLATTAATLGFDFALAKTFIAFCFGLLGGFVTAGFAQRPWALAPLRENRLVGQLGCHSACAPEGYVLAVWRDPGRRRVFRSEALATTRLILICLTPAFAAEYALNAFLEPDSLAPYLGEDSWWSVPVAVFVGAPAYLDGYAALPLTRGLLDHGMAPGAAMAFLVAGGVVSVWGAIAIAPVLKIKPFLLYLALAVAGSLLAGWGYGALA
ncbi:MAG: permease [Pseudomonadota bacterium]